MVSCWINRGSPEIHTLAGKTNLLRQLIEFMTTIEAIEVLKNNQCRCGAGKQFKTAFCNQCYRSLPPSVRRSLYSRIGGGFEQAYELAAQTLAKNNTADVLRGYCRKCGKAVVFLKLKKADGTIGKNNPIEAAPHSKGNLVVSLEKGLYRFATKDELELAHRENKNLYISHFAYCEFAKSFTKQRHKTV